MIFLVAFASRHSPDQMRCVVIRRLATMGAVRSNFHSYAPLSEDMSLMSGVEGTSCGSSTLGEESMFVPNSPSAESRSTALEPTAIQESSLISNEETAVPDSCLSDDPHTSADDRAYLDESASFENPISGTYQMKNL